MITSGPRGTKDILPGEAEKWQYLEFLIRQICREYGYREIRTPIFEHTELFHRGVGDTTDIVEKEMYTFTDRGERSLTLRPEGTAPTVRAFMEHKLYAGSLPAKLFYIGPMFRFSRPQAGRFRQFHQFGVEVFGARDPKVDAEVIALAMDFYGRLGLQGLELRLNSVGCPQCRPSHRQALHEFLRPRLEELCPTCQGRFERNPMRILDCKSDKCQEISQGAPTTVGSLCQDCGEHFEQVKKYLDTLGVAYVLDDRLVRGLDYYTNTAFEIVASGVGAQSSIGGGGRYDGLVEQCGGPSIPGIGFGLGLERILLTMEAQGIKLPVAQGAQVFVATAGQGLEVKAMELLFALRKAGLAAEIDYQTRGLKAQLKQAARLGVALAVILGEEEMGRGVAVVRSMAQGDQEEVSLEKLVDYLKEATNANGVV